MMKIKYIIYMLMTLTATQLRAQDFEWAKSTGGVGMDEGRAIITDDAGNIYSTGFFNGTVDFDPGVGTLNLTSSSGGSSYIQKLNNNGDLLWAKSFGQANGYSIAVDIDGNIYTTGVFLGAVDFDPGTGTEILTSSGAGDIFIHKLDANGDFVWVRAIGGPNQDIGYSIALDVSGNVYTTGFFYGLIDFDPGAGTTNLNSNGYDDVFIQKLDPNGNLIWAKSFGGSILDRGNSIKLDNAGNVYTTGFFGGTIDFDPGAGVSSLTSNGNDDVFIQKLDANGNFIWAKAMGGSSNDRGSSMVIDTGGNIFTTGYFFGTADFDPGVGVVNLVSNGSSDIFIQKLDDSGNLLWVKSMGGIIGDIGHAIAIDDSGNVYTTGHFGSNVDFDPGIGVTDLTSSGSSDIFIQKLDAVGNLIWAKSMTGSTNVDYGFSISLESNGNIYTTGSFHETIDFDPGVGTTYLTSNGVRDIFINKLSQCVPTSSTDIHSACNSYTWIDGNTYTLNNNVATHTLTNVAGCDSIVTLNLTISNPNTGTDVQTACDSYTWIDGNTYTSNNNVATHTLTNVAGCDSVVTLDLTINTVNVTTSVSDNTITADASGLSYQWIDCIDNSELVGEINQSFIPITNGEYAVEITENSCTDTSDCVVVNTIGILEQNTLSTFQIYPNPTNETLYLSNEKLAEYDITIFSISGEVIFSEKGINTQLYQIELTGANTGIYYVQISSENMNKEYKLIKQ